MGSSAPRQRTTLVLVIVAALLEHADEALLPAVYREVGAALGASPAALGSLTLCRALAQAACYPLAACAAARHDRARVVAAGAVLWAVATLLVGASSTYVQMAAARGFNGVGLALVVPAIYSLVADCSDDATRGAAFGWLQLALTMGYVVGGSLGVLLAPTAFLGVPGWRLAFLAVALLSASLAALTWTFAADPRPGSTKDAMATAAELFREIKGVFRVPTFRIVVAQAVAGSVSMSALGFAAMWLELLGFTHWETTVVTNLSYLAIALGALCSGLVADRLARRFPDAGRVALAQASTASTVPLAAVLLLALPGDPSAAASYAAVFFALGFAASWCPAGTNNPILAEIVPETARTTVYALDKSFESVFAAFGAPVVGVLAERVFGYQPAATAGASVEADRGNAAALGKAIFAAIAVPITVSCLAYTLLYWTYPADRQSAQMAALHAASGELDGDSEASRVASATAADGVNEALLHYNPVQNTSGGITV
ncbi:hypothetical protein ACP70R_021186 [Stipagrostis hirtigluma subsp. patula]